MRQLASAMLFTSPTSPADGSQLDVRSRSAPFPGHAEREAELGDARCLQLSTMFINMKIKDLIAQTRIVQEFRSTKQSWSTESYYYVRLPTEAAVTSFKVEIGDNHAIEDETRPSKQARKLYIKAVHNRRPAAILKQVEPGIYQANLGRIPPDVEVTIVVKCAQCIASNAGGKLIITYPAVSPCGRSSFSGDTKVALNIEITQEDPIRTIASPTHQKLLSIKAGVMGASNEAQNFASFQHRAQVSSSEQPVQATVNLSGSHTVLDKDFELVITTSNETQKTAASLSAINKFGHAVLTITIRPWDLFNGERDTEWSVDFELNHPWTCCSTDLSELNLTRIPHHSANLSPSTYKFVQSPKMTRKISHLQNYSVFFLLDFKGSTEYSLDSVRINAIPTSGSHPVRTMTLSVNRTHKSDGILQKLCVSSILRDLYTATISQDHPQLYWEGRSFGLSSLVTSAERLGQMYSICNRWTSKVAADTISDSDDDVDSNGTRLYEDELSRLTLPTRLSSPDRPAMIVRPQACRMHSRRSKATNRRSWILPGSLDYSQGSSLTGSGGRSHLTMDQNPSREDKDANAPLNPLNQYFVPRDGIDREVITADIARYLGNDALVRPGTFENEEDGRATQGYFITAYRNLTSEMIADLKADSARRDQERRDNNPGTSQHDARQGYAVGRKATAGSSYPIPATGAGPSMSGAGQYQPQARYQDCSMATSTYDSPYPDANNSQHYADAYFASDRPRMSIHPGRQEPRGQDSHEAQRIWPQIAASRSVDGAYALSADLRDRIAANFNPGTWAWLVARIAAIVPDENSPLSSEAAADTMLVLAFVKTYIFSLYEVVEQGVGLILKSGQDQREILEELVLRVRVRARDDRPRRR